MPLPHPRRQRRAAVQRHGADFVHHLGQQRDCISGLHDKQIVVVGAGQDGRSRVEPGDASGPGREVLGLSRVELGHRQHPQALTRVWAHRRQPAVRRVGDQRRPPLGPRRARVGPEAVVGSGLAGGRRAVARIETRLFLGRGQLLVAEDGRIPKLFRALERGGRDKAPKARQVGMPVRCARDSWVAGGGGSAAFALSEQSHVWRRRDTYRSHDTDSCDDRLNSTSHPALLNIAGVRNANPCRTLPTRITRDGCARCGTSPRPRGVAAPPGRAHTRCPRHRPFGCR